MELKVWVEGIQRIVCGVTEATTCQDVVYALAHATGKTGRFTLVERWRHNERLLPPHERPLRVLAKWGEYANDVQLLLRRSPSPPSGAAHTTSAPVPANQPTAKPSRLPQPPSNCTTGDNDHGFILDPALDGRAPASRAPANSAASPPGAAETNHHGRDPLVRKSLTFSGSGGGGGGGGGAMAPPTYHDPPPFRDAPNGKRDWSVLPRGVVKGVPQSNYKDPTCSPPDNPGSSKEQCGQEANSAVSPPATKPCVRPGGAAGMSGPPQYQPPPMIHRTEPPVNGRGSHGPDATAPLQEAGPHASHVKSEPESLPATRIPTAVNASHLRAALPASQESSACAMVDISSSPSSGSPAGHQRPPSDAHVGQPIHQHHQQATFRGGPPMAVRHPSPSNNAELVHHHHQVASQSSPHRGATSPPAAPRLPVPIHMGTPKSRRNLLSEFRRHDLEEELREDSFLGRGHQERVVYDARYKDLVRLINLQREKLGRQQADLTQCDAEIMYWEEKQKDHQRQIEIIEREIQKAEYSGRDADEEVVQLNKLHLDDEMGIGRQQEKMLQSELTLLRSKLSNCETELLQCKNKIRLLMDEIIESKRSLSKEEEDRKQRETVIFHEIEDLQRDIENRIKQYDSTVDSVDKLDNDIRQLESAILEKKKQIECLVHEMKEANLASLTFTPSEEIRLLLEGGAHKGPGSSRKIVGSPRQLENAVPTSKNPHGVWV